MAARRSKPAPAPSSRTKSGDERKRVPERTRADLIEAASRLFLREGLDGPSLDAICEEAGYTRGAFYVHFGSRDELVSAVVETAMTELLESIVKPDEDLPQIISSFVEALGEGRLPIAGHARISQVLEACARSWELRVKFLAVLVTARQRIAEAVRRSQSHGVVRESARPDAVAEMLLALVLGVQVAAQLGAPYDARAVEAELREMLARPEEGERRKRGGRRGPSDP